MPLSICLHETFQNFSRYTLPRIRIEFAIWHDNVMKDVESTYRGHVKSKTRSRAGSDGS